MCKRIVWASFPNINLLIKAKNSLELEAFVQNNVGYLLTEVVTERLTFFHPEDDQNFVLWNKRLAALFDCTKKETEGK